MTSENSLLRTKLKKLERENQVHKNKNLEQERSNLEIENLKQLAEAKDSELSRLNLDLKKVHRSLNRYRFKQKVRQLARTKRSDQKSLVRKLRNEIKNKNELLLENSKNIQILTGGLKRESEQSNDQFESKDIVRYMERLRKELDFLEKLED